MDESTPRFDETGPTDPRTRADGSAAPREADEAQVPVRLRRVADAAGVLNRAGALPGSIAGRYQVIGEIARGGVGIVFRTLDVDLGRDVAMKVLRDEYASREDIVQRFVEEAQVGGQLQHPGIVPVYELGLGSDGRPYFTMKLVKGRTLAALLAARASPAQDRARFVALFESICRTLAYAHARRVIHRDLKPSNVMIGAFGEVQVMDWGLSKVLAQGGVADERRPGPSPESLSRSIIETVRTGSQSLVGSVLGTPWYMSPEQARGENDRIDARSDVFSLGAILCEILTGAPPWDGEGIAVLRAAASGDTTAAAARLRACGADPDLVAVAERCLAADPAHRPADGGELAAAISEHLRSVDERARTAVRASAAARVTAEAQRRARRLVVGIGASVVAGLAAVGGGVAWFVGQRAERAAVEERAAADGLVFARTLQGRASAKGTVAAWERALDAAVGAHSAAAAAGGDADVVAQADGLARQVRESLDAARSADERTVRAGALVGALDDVLLDTTDVPLRTGEAAYAAAFRGAGLDTAAPDFAESAGRLGPAAAERIVLALDDWAEERRSAGADTAALAAAAQAIDRDPFRKSLAAARGLADLQRLAGDDAAARSVSAADAVLLARALERAGDGDLAYAVLRDAQQAHADDLRTVLRFAEFLRRRRPPQLFDARRMFSAARAIRPDSAQILDRIARIALDLGDLPTAIATWTRAVERAPSCARAQDGLAEATARTGDADGAIARHREAVRLRPDDPFLALRLGRVLMRAGRFREAADVLRAAHTSGSRRLDWPEPHSDEELAQADRLAALEPDLAAVVQGRRAPTSRAELLDFARLCAGRGQRARAAELYQRVLADGPPPPGLRTEAAAAACAAAAGRAEDSARLSADDRAALRARAVGWLGAEMDRWDEDFAGDSEAGMDEQIREISQWRTDATFAPIRDEPQLRALPAAERAACETLWDRVAQTFARAGRL